MKTRAQVLAERAKKTQELPITSEAEFQKKLDDVVERGVQRLAKIKPLPRDLRTIEMVKKVLDDVAINLIDPMQRRSFYEELIAEALDRVENLPKPRKKS